jgi:hypothetical protein
MRLPQLAKMAANKVLEGVFGLSFLLQFIPYLSC